MDVGYNYTTSNCGNCSSREEYGFVGVINLQNQLSIFHTSSYCKIRMTFFSLRFVDLSSTAVRAVTSYENARYTNNAVPSSAFIEEAIMHLNTFYK